MKTINRLLSLAVMMSLGMAVTTSCTDDNDWSVDGSHDRLFGVLSNSISVTTTLNTATVTFKGISGAEYYVLETSTDTLRDDMPIGTGENSVVYGADGSIKASPVTLENLNRETKYFLRIKSCSSTANESKWVYDDFKTQAEQIFYETTDADRGSSSVRLTWQPGAEVTHILVIWSTEDGADTTEVRLDTDDLAEARANGEYTVTGLNPLTNYTFELYNGDLKRGSLTVATAAAPPAAAYVVELDADATELNQDMFDEYAAAATAAAGPGEAPTLTICFKPGVTYDMHGYNESGEAMKLKVPDGLSVTFFGMAGTVPTLNFTHSLEIGGSHTYIRFDNVNIVDGGCQYLINQSDGCVVDEMSFSGVKIDGLSRSLVRYQGDAAKTLSTVNIDDCVINNQGGGGYAMIYVSSANYTMKEINITNSTFSNMQHNFIQVGSTKELANINISNCTFYKVIGNEGRYLVDAKDIAPNVTLNSVLLGATYSTKGGRGIRTNGEKTILNTYMTTDFVLTSNKFEADITTPELTAAELYADPDNGDFTVTNATLAELGDPRWMTAEE